MLMALPDARAEFALRNDDTIVFLGDSITAARQYSKIIEDYTLLRFPDRKVRFINAGHGGETMHGVLARLNEAVFSQGATIVTVAYGVNDIGWGARADAEHRQQYLDAVGTLLTRCQEHHVRVYLCSAAITAENPDTAEHGFLQAMCDQGMALAKSRGEHAIDVQRLMRQVQRRVLAANQRADGKNKPVRMHTEDGIHLNDLGQMAMAWAILKGLGAPADVSSATLDATSSKIIDAAGCKISDVQKTSDGISFERLDEGLPLNLQPLWMLNGMFIPFSDDLNRYMLSIRGLERGRYSITAGGRALGTWDADALTRGINIASASADPWVPGGPWDAQGHIVKTLTDMRDEIVFARRQMEQNLTTKPALESMLAKSKVLEETIVELQRETARPVPAKFVVQKSPSLPATP